MQKYTLFTLIISAISAYAADIPNNPNHRENKIRNTRYHSTSVRTSHRTERKQRASALLKQKAETDTQENKKHSNKSKKPMLYAKIVHKQDQRHKIKHF